MFYRPTWAEINLANLAYNLNSIRKLISKDTKILAVIKADAYGHGILAVAKKLLSLGIKYLGVASLDEAIVLRKAGIESNILILGGIFPKDSEAVVRHNLTQAVYSLKVAKALDSSAKKQAKKVRVHVKIDTGMGRLGVWHSEAFDFVRKIKRFRFLEVEGIFTHLSSADTDANFTNNQITVFTRLIKKLESCGINIPLRHISNSLGVVDFKHSHLNLVRPGIMLYGLSPRKNLRIKIKPLLSLKTRIISLKTVPSGRSISYGRSFITKKKSVIAALPIGYGDGYARILSNKAEVLIRGRRFKVIGRVCMDYIMADISGIKNPKVGEEVILIGRDRKNIISAEELADLAGTICYEIVCGIAKRVPRVYID
jgi:alanine racemase